MASNADAQEMRSQLHQRIALLLLAGLLFLRLPLLAGVTYFSENRVDLSRLDQVFQIGTYVLTACLLWWERQRLADFHIDKLSVTMIILFKPLETLILTFWGFKSDLTFPSVASLIIWGTALGLFLALWLSRTKLPRMRAKNFGWLGIGVLAGIATALFLGYPMSFQISKSELNGIPSLSALLPQWTTGFLYQIGYAAVSEEPLFRGFLWGYLRKAGWKDLWVWLFQAGLFMLGHIYYVSRAPISFWIIVPTSGLVLGLLAWRSRSIATSLAAHGVENALGYSVGLLIAAARL